MKHLYILIIFILIADVNGCNKKNETTVSATSFVLTSDPYLSLMQNEVDQYMSLYPQVKMEVRGTSTREAIVHLLNDSVRSIVVDRPFNEEEQQVAQQAYLKFAVSKIGEDGVAIIVHKQNSILNITSESVRRILTGGASTDWNQIQNFKQSGAVDLVLTDRNSGMYELLQKKLFSIKQALKPTAIMNNQSEVVQYVSTHPQSIGFVSASLVIDDRKNIKVLPVLAKSSDGIEKECLPGQQEIHDLLYPFHYSLYLYNAEAKTAVGVGFSAFVLSNVGQKVIQKAGLVPAFIPYRTIQLHAE
jgi:phosphate transport system substrate-binding protein